MASGKVARRAAVDEIAALLDSPEVAALIAELERSDGGAEVARATVPAPSSEPVS